MSKEQDWRNLGEQILDSVADALNSGDFRQLNNLVSGTVNDAVKEAKRQADYERIAREDSLRQYRQMNEENHAKWLAQQEEIRKRQEERREEWRRIRQAQIEGRRRAEESYASRQSRDGSLESASEDLGVARQASRPPRVAKAKFKQVGSVSSVLFTVFGALGLGVGCSLALVAMILFFANAGSVVPFAFFSVLTLALSISFLGKGGRQRRLLKRAQRYIQLCGDKMYADVSYLASQTGKSVKYVRKDIKKMLNKGMFPEGHLDAQETCFILSDEVYRQYTETAQAYQMREQMEKERLAAENRTLTPEEQERAEANAQENELNAMMAEGMEYVRKLRELNDAIPGEEISAQLTQLESLLKQIFDRVKEHPEQMNRMHKLMDYYLPTTVKLVEAYVQFEKVETPGKDIQGAKSEILKTLGIINEAFTELLNNLFQDAVFDATTDAQVLQTMLSREGLRREMSAQPAASAQAEESAEPEEEDTPFQLSMEPEQPEVQMALKAPWES